MSKWNRLKVALLTAVTMLSALQLGGCLPGNLWDELIQMVVIGNVLD